MLTILRHHDVHGLRQSLQPRHVALADVRGAPSRVTEFSYVAIQYPRPGWGKLTPFPFERRGKAFEALLHTIIIDYNLYM